MEIAAAICSLFGGLGVLLFGFKVLSDAIEKLANNKLRQLFSKTSTSGKFAGLGIGTATTALIQSSAATTVMTVGFVNAGVMSLTMATAIIMGANIGTTITGYIAALGSFSFSVFVLPFAFLGILVAMISKKDTVKTISYIVGGVGLVFVGLQLMSTSMKIFTEDPVFQQAINAISNPFLLLLLGIAITALLQSSSAVTSIVISLATATSGALFGGVNGVLFLILGTNIGTCITALISSIGANINAKRAAFIHLLFNVFGVVIFLIPLLIWNFPENNFLDTVLGWMHNPGLEIAVFHTIFNVICVLIFFPFVNVFVNVATFVVHERKKVARDRQTEPDISNSLLDDRFLETPAIAVLQAKKEAVRLATISLGILTESVDSFLAKDKDAMHHIRKNIAQVVESAKAYTKFLIKLASRDISYQDEKTISALHESLADILRIADLADNMTKYTVHYVDDNLDFSETMCSEIKQMDRQIHELFDVSILAFNGTDKTAVVKAEEYEDDIDKLKKQMIDGHIKRMNEGKCQPQSSSVMINLVGNMERAADHILNLAHAFDKK